MGKCEAMALDRRSYELMVQGRDLPWILRQWVTRTPDKDFLIWVPHEGAHRRWSYAQFDADVRACAGGLQRQGIDKGSRVLLHLENCPELLIAYFACAAIGAVAVLDNMRSTEAEIAWYLELVAPTAIITQPYHRELFTRIAPAGCSLVVASQPCGPDGAEPGALSFDDLLDAEPFSDDRPPEPMLDLRVQFTSGTTSRPKAVLSTHANTLFAAQQTAYAYGLRQDDICQLFVPLFHNNGLATLAMSTLWSGGTILLQPKFSASNFWGPALRYGATWTSLPSIFFVNALARYDVPKHHFRFWSFAVMPEIEKRYGVKTRGHWGMTEMITLPLVGDPFHVGGLLNIGRPAPGNEIAIRRPDGSDCSPGETGHLFVRGVRGITIFKEYLNDPQATAACFDEDGWFDTGDRVRIDERGDIFFASRAKDMLRVGGENVAAAEIEAVIMSSGWVEECAVVGKPDVMLDEVPVAFVIPADGAPEDLPNALIRRSAGQLADFKALREVHIVNDLPRSTLNKIAKRKLRAMLESGEVV